MQASFRAARNSCAPLLLFAISTAVQAQTWFSINDVGADIDEQQIEKSLTQRGSVDFVETGLQDAVAMLSRQFQVQIVLSIKKLEEASVSADRPITTKLQDLPLESILRLMLTDLDLGFTVRDNVILISSPEDIESRLQTRVYPVLDLATQRRLSSNDAPRSIGADYDSLIELITSTIRPDSWDDVGGPGAIDALDNAGVLVTSQTRDVHRQIENLLGSLRQAKAFQGIPSLPMPAITRQRLSSLPIAGTTRRTSPTQAQAWQLPHVYPAEK